MKKYIRPIMEIENWITNEYVSSCVSFVCSHYELEELKVSMQPEGTKGECWDEILGLYENTSDGSKLVTSLMYSDNCNNTITVNENFLHKGYVSYIIRYDTDANGYSDTDIEGEYDVYFAYGEDVKGENSSVCFVHYTTGEVSPANNVS